MKMVVCLVELVEEDDEEIRLSVQLPECLCAENLAIVAGTVMACAVQQGADSELIMEAARSYASCSEPIRRPAPMVLSGGMG